MEEFEYERKFVVTDPTLVPRVNVALLVQAYIFLSEDISVRVRLSESRAENIRRISTKLHESGEISGDILSYFDASEIALLTVKEGGNEVVTGGTRYEKEMHISIDIARRLVLTAYQREPKLVIIKKRYSHVSTEDTENSWAWDIDEFMCLNAPLILAECEGAEPVIDLTIPNFCATEVTSDHRFTNAYLAENPYSYWHEEWTQELKQSGPHFSPDFGTNRWV